MGDALLSYYLERDSPPRVRKLTVAGFYHTGTAEVEKGFAIGEWVVVQTVANWEARGGMGCGGKVQDCTGAECKQGRERACLRKDRVGGGNSAVTVDTVYLPLLYRHVLRVGRRIAVIAQANVQLTVLREVDIAAVVIAR